MEVIWNSHQSICYQSILIHPSIHQSIHPFIHPSMIYSSIHSLILHYFRTRHFTYWNWTINRCHDEWRWMSFTCCSCMERIHSSKVCIATLQHISTSIYASVPLIHLSVTRSYIYPSTCISLIHLSDSIIPLLFILLLSIYIYLHSFEYIIHMYVYPQITKDYRNALSWFYIIIWCCGR